MIGTEIVTALGKVGQGPFLVEMQRIEGDLAWTNTLEFLTEDRLRYQVRFKAAPSEIPEFEPYPAETALRSPFANDGEGVFSVETTLPEGGDGLWTVWSRDTTDIDPHLPVEPGCRNLATRQRQRRYRGQ